MHSISKLRQEKGFTLIELLIVIVVLGILAGIVLFAVGTTRDDATTAKNSSNAKICKTAYQAALTKYGSSPTANQVNEYADGDPCTATGGVAGP